MASRVSSSILLGCPPPIGGRSESMPSKLNSAITPRTWFSSVCNTRAISRADTSESDAKRICAR